MELVSFNPWNDVWNMNNRFNRIFGSRFAPARILKENRDFVWRPAVDLPRVAWGKNGTARKSRSR